MRKDSNRYFGAMGAIIALVLFSFVAHQITDQEDHKYLDPRQLGLRAEPEECVQGTDVSREITELFATNWENRLNGIYIPSDLTQTVKLHLRI